MTNISNALRGDRLQFVLKEDQYCSSAYVARIFYHRRHCHIHVNHFRLNGIKLVFAKMFCTS